MCPYARTCQNGKRGGTAAHSIAIASAAASLFLAASPDQAATRSWTGLDPGGPRWDLSRNWSPLGQPEHGDAALLLRSGAAAYTVEYFNLDPLRILTDVQIDQLSGGTVTLHFGMNHRLAADMEYLGYRTGGRGRISQGTGTNTITTGLALGWISGSFGSYDLGGGTLIVSGGKEAIGDAGDGSFAQSGGYHLVGQSVPGSLYLGYGTLSAGRYDLSAGSLSTGQTTVGQFGDGDFDQNGGTHSALALVVAGQAASDSVYTLRGTGALSSLYYEQIGNEGAGSFVQSGGTNTTHDSLTLGGYYTGRGYYGLSGGTLAVQQNGHDGHILLGNAGAGTFDQTGGQVTISTYGAGDSLMLGYGTGSASLGTYWLQAGTLSANGKEYIGYISGLANRFIHTGGVNTAPELYVGFADTARGQYTLDKAGSLSTTGDQYIGYNGIGTFIHARGSNSVGYGHSLFIGYNAGSAGRYELRSGNLDVQGATVLGSAGSGSFLQSGGGHSALYLSVGSEMGSAGYYQLEGSASLGTLYYEVVGGAGAGTFNQTGGTNSTHDALWVGYGPKGAGTYLLSGGTLSITGAGHDGAAFIGYDGQGTFDQSRGTATIATSTGASLYVGYGSTSTGRYLLRDGTLFTNSSEIVGYNGAGTFDQSGGANTTSSLYLGYFAAGRGMYAKSAGTLSAGHVHVGYGTFTHSGGTLSVSGDFTNSDRSTIGGTQDWAPGSWFYNNAAAAVATFTTDAGSSAARKLSVWAQMGTVAFASSQHLAGLRLYAGSRATLTPGGAKVLTTGWLEIEGGADPLARLDLADNDLIIDYTGTSPYLAVYDWIRHGYANGAWTGQGIATSSAGAAHGLGFAEAAALALASFSGEPVDSTAVVVKFTYNGDANLDGQVDVVDLGILATHWQTSAYWTGGDFNYTGGVDVVDLGLLASNWQAGVGNPLGPGSLDQALVAYGLPAVGIPDPAGAAALLVAAGAATLRRRRR